MKFLAACCTVKNEFAIIKEWMAFHRAAGVEKLIVIDNGSTDDTSTAVREFPDQDGVDLISWPNRDSQVAMYDHVIARYRDEFEWCAFIDADEFLFSSSQKDLRVVLSEMPRASAIGVHWLIYGSAGHKTQPAGHVIANFQRRSPCDFIFNRHVKSIVRLKEANKALSSHVFSVGSRFLNDVGQPMHCEEPFGFYPHLTPSFAHLRINHYHTRSYEEYLQKASRGYFGVDDDKLKDQERIDAMFAAHDRNEVEDGAALAFLPLMEFYLAPK